jgi:hypothetical protein
MKVSEETRQCFSSCLQCHPNCTKTLTRRLTMDGEHTHRDLSMAVAWEHYVRRYMSR